MTKIDSRLQGNLQLCYFQAKLDHYAFYTVEILLYVLLDNADVFQALKALECDIESLRGELKSAIEKTTPRQPETSDADPEPSLGFERVLQLALVHVQSCGRRNQTVTALDVVVAMYEEQDGHAAHLLEQCGVLRLALIDYMGSAEHKGAGGETTAASAEEPDADPEAQTEPGLSAQQLLGRYAVNLNERALQGSIDPLIGRTAEIDRMSIVLCRRHKNNPLLVGDPGVGKTALAEGLALAIVEKKVPEILQSRVIWSLDVGALIAGSMMRGEFEKRIKSVIEAVKAMPEAVLFIDEIQSVVGAGGQHGTNDAATLMKPALSHGELACIGATTYEEYRQIFEKDRALARRFQKIDVCEPTQEQALAILKGLKARFEQHHQVRYSPAALLAAVELSGRYLQDRKLPDKAVDVIDEAGAARRVLKGGPSRWIGAQEIEAVVGKMARVPVQALQGDETARLRSLEHKLRQAVFGQDTAVQAVTQAIKLSRSGLGAASRPVGSFLFTGPTGVGKTELARVLAQHLGIELVRFDMSEYAERHTVSRLLGAPPGYVGYEKGGELTEALAQHPHCVLLLDELEKAHPDIYNILLQVMDNGELTDANGRSVDFRHCIVIMTTNAGAQEQSRQSIGFSSQVQWGDSDEAVKRTFMPEFRNRLDAIVTFVPLSEPVIARVVDKFLEQVREQLAGKNVKVLFTEALRQYLSQKGFDPAMGARPMRRLIQDALLAPLADALLFGPLCKGGLVRIGLDAAGCPSFDYRSVRQPAASVRQLTQKIQDKTQLGAGTVSLLRKKTL